MKNVSTLRWWMDVLLVGDDGVVDGATAVELLHLVSCLPAPVFNLESEGFLR